MPKQAIMGGERAGEGLVEVAAFNPSRAITQALETKSSSVWRRSGVPELHL